MDAKNNGKISFALGHVAFYVKDIEASVEFYTRVFGFPEAFRLTRDDGSLGGVYLYVAENQFMELFPSSASSAGEKTNSGILGYAHFCLQVEKLETALDRVRAAGASIDVEMRTGISKCRMFWTSDPDGNKIEVMELPPESMQSKANARFMT